MKRCKRCIMPETVPGVVINEAGLCSYCRSYEEENYSQRKNLDTIVAEAKSKGNKYHCIVPVSGGRDSTYVLYVAKKQYDLNVLAVNYNNEFGIQQAFINMKRACELLNVHFVSIRSKTGIAHKIVKHNIRAATEFGQFRECAACTYGYRSVVYRAAEQYKVPLIFWGESNQESTAPLELKAFEQIRQHKLKFLKLLKIDFYIAEYYRLLQRLEFYISWRNIFNRGYEPRFNSNEIKEIRVFDYIKWDREIIKKTLLSELGWQKPAECISTWKTDCSLIALANFYYVKLFGCTKLCFGYCRMINSGQMERHEALRQEESYLSNYSNGVRQLLEGNIGLSKKKADRILRSQPRADISL